MDYKPFLTTDKNGERNDKNSYNEILDRNRIKIAEGVLDRHESMIKQLLGDDSNLTETTDSNVAYMKQVPANALNYAELLNVGGMCQKVNQLLPTSALASTSSQLGVTKTNNGDGSFTMSGTADGGTAYLYFLSTTRTLIQSHKYCVFALGNFNKIANMRIRAKTEPDGANSYFNPNTIVTGYVSFDQIFFSVPDGETASGSVHLTLVDISDAYPTDTPTSTSDPRIQWLISYLSSHPEYDAGSIITAPVTKVVSKGFNLWDEEYEAGVLNTITGAPQGSSGIRSKNYISVHPSTTYYGCDSNSAANLWLMFFDKDKNVIVPNNSEIGGTSTYENAVSADMHTFTTPSNCRYIKFYMSQSYGTTYNHDICINVSNASLNGTYMPYRAPIEYPIPAEVRALDGYGYGLSADCYNKVSYEGKSYGKKVARVDLSTLNFTYNSTYGVFSTSDLSSEIKIPATQATVSEAKAEKYNMTFQNNITTAEIGTMCVVANGNLFIRANEGDTISGYLYYPLREPVETDISEYLPFDDYIEVEAGGSVVFENTNEIDVPSEIVYLEEVSE